MINVSATSKHDHIFTQHTHYQHAPPHYHSSRYNLVDMQRYDFFFSHRTFSIKSCVFSMKNSLPAPFVKDV